MTRQFGSGITERSRRRHAFRATVVGHRTRTMGMLWWKKSCPCLVVRFSDVDYNRFVDILRHGNGMRMRIFGKPPQHEIDVAFVGSTGLLRSLFSIGDMVEVRFSTTGSIAQFITGKKPLRWDGISKRHMLAN